MTLYLCVNGVLRKPLLYLSLYLKTNRSECYRLLQEVREPGAWEAWLDFFTSPALRIQPIKPSRLLPELSICSRKTANGLRQKATGQAPCCVSTICFRQNPFLTASQLVQKTGLSAPTVNAALARSGAVRHRRGNHRA